MTNSERVLPPGWSWMKLGDVCEQTRNIIEPNSTLSTQLSYLGLEHIESGTGRILRQPGQTMEGEGKSTAFAFDSRHVLYGKLRPYLNKVALPHFSGRCTTELIPLLPISVEREYLAWIMRRPETVEAAMRDKTGSRMPRADIDELLRLAIPVPPVAEQKRIAAILTEQMTAVARLRAAALAQLQSAQALPSAYVRKVFEQSPEWVTVQLGELAKIVRGSSPRPKGDTRYFGGNVPRLMVEDVTRDGMYVTPKIDYLTKEGATLSRPMKKGEVVMVVSGAPGLPAILATDACIHDGFVGFRELRTQRIHPEFLYFSLLLSKDMNDAQATGAIFRNLTTDQVALIPIPLPELVIQTKIVTKLNEFLDLAGTATKPLKAQLAAIEQLPTALLRQAFAGEL